MEIKKKNFIKIISNNNIYNIEKKIEKIFKKIKEKGEFQLIKYIKKYDKIFSNFIYKVRKNIFSKLEKKTVKKFINRIYKFHKYQYKKIGIKNWKINNDKFFNIIGQKCSPIKKVLIYVPGGKFSYISSLVMNIIPARIAGVKKIYISTPAKGLKFLKIVSLCKILNIKKIFRIGGAHSIFAFALGTKNVPKVNKIVGPGNLYVSLAKKKVFGIVGIDNIAGPTEILIITDGKCLLKNIVNDVMAQLEHDVNSKAFILSFNYNFLKKIKKKFNKKKTLKKNINIFFLKNLNDCCKLSNKIGPEHLELIINNNKKKILKKLNNYGSLFIGEKTCETLGDYCAGTNHVLPTNSTCKYSSPLGVNDFLKLNNILKIKNNRFKKIGTYSFCIAKIEGLKYHKKSILNRM
ncbi:histidinol dehydrogenase [Candidatus Vidania fulgoroideorum]